MCGAINLLATTSSTRNLKKPLFYNLGRLISYTLLGGIVGLLGSVLRINVYVQGFIIILASIFMILMSLNMMGIINFSFNFKRINLFNNVKAKGSFMIGLLNGFMPAVHYKQCSYMLYQRVHLFMGPYLCFCFV